MPREFWGVIDVVRQARVIQGHSGAVFFGEDKQSATQQTVHQEAFHDALRAKFTGTGKEVDASRMGSSFQCGR